MSKIIKPNPWAPTTPHPDIELNSVVELLDSDILAIKNGPLAYARRWEGSRLNIDRFTKDLVEQFAHINLGADVQVWTTEIPGVYTFKVEIQKRYTPFDKDRMTHEVRADILDIDEDPGHIISTSKSMLEFEREMRDNPPEHR